MTDFTTGAGATISLASAAPATFDAAGYAALTYTPVGKVTNFGDVPSRTYQEVVVMYLASEGEDVAKGGYSLGSQVITVALDNSDAGQTLLDTATNSKSAYSIKLAHPVLGTIYARALIMGGPKTYGDNNTAATQQVTLRYKMANATTDGIVKVPAA